MDNYSTIRASMQAINKRLGCRISQRPPHRKTGDGFGLTRENLGAKGSGFLGFARNDIGRIWGRRGADSSASLGMTYGRVLRLAGAKTV